MFKKKKAKEHLLNLIMMSYFLYLVFYFVKNIAYTPHSLDILILVSSYVFFPNKKHVCSNQIRLGIVWVKTHNVIIFINIVLNH